MTEQPAPSYLDSLRYYDHIRLNLTQAGVYNISRSEDSKLDMLKRVGGAEDEEPVILCHIASMGSLTLGRSYPHVAAYEELTAMAMAAHHLNTGDGSIVREVKGLDLRCPIRFTMEFRDNELDRRVAVQNAIEYLERPRDDPEKRLPCAFVGGRASEITSPTAVLTGINDFVQMGGSATSPALDDKSQYPLFTRTFPSDVGKSVAFVRYLQTLDVRHLAVINVNDSYGNQLADAIRQAVREHANDEIVVQQIPLGEDSGSIPGVISSLKTTEFRFIFCAIHTVEHHDAMMLEAYRQGVAGDGKHNWFFDDPFTDLLTDRHFEKGSELALAYRGAGQVLLTAFAPNTGYGPADGFLEKSALIYNPADIEYMNSLFHHEKHEGNSLYDAGIIPVKNGEYINIMADPDLLQSRAEAFYYDGVVALGLAACDAYLKKGIAFTGQDQFVSMVDNVFVGVTGTVRLDPLTGTRDPSSSNYQCTNRGVLREINETHVGFDSVTTDRFVNGQWIKEADYIFNSGFAKIPADIPPSNIHDNAVSAAVRGIVLGMCALSLVLSIGFSVWTVRQRKTHVIRASQPFFLHTICIGVFIFSSSIIPLSFDHGIVSDAGCTIACNSTIWLISLGFCVTFSALFTKNYRINKLLTGSSKLRRVQVSIRDVAIPMISLLSINTILLATMTALAHVQYETEVLALDIFDRPSETFARCSLDDGQAPYIAVLIIVNAVCLLYAIFQAYQARHLSTEFGESKYVFKALTSTLLVGLIGVPVLLLARDNTNASTFVSSAIIFVACTSILLFIFVPKIQYLKKEGDKDDRFQKALARIAAKASGRGDAYSDENLFVGNSVVSGLFETDIGASAHGSERFSLARVDESTRSAGIQVYGFQTKEELVVQNETLKTEVARLRRRLNFLISPVDGSNAVPMEAPSSAEGDCGKAKAATSGVECEKALDEASKAPQNQAAMP